MILNICCNEKYGFDFGLYSIKMDKVFNLEVKNAYLHKDSISK